MIEDLIFLPSLRAYNQKVCNESFDHYYDGSSHKGIGRVCGTKIYLSKKIKIIDLVLFVYDENQKINTATIQIPHRLEPSYSKHH